MTSLSGLNELDATLLDADRELAQIAGGMKTLGTTPSSLTLHGHSKGSRNVSQASMGMLCDVVQSVTSRLVKMNLVRFDMVEHSMVSLVQSCGYYATMSSIEWVRTNSNPCHYTQTNMLAWLYVAYRMSSNSTSVSKSEQFDFKLFMIECDDNSSFNIIRLNQLLNDS